MAEFRFGRLLLRSAERTEPGTPLDRAGVRELEDDLLGAVSDPMLMRSLARFLDATIVYSGEHLLEVLIDKVLAGQVIVHRERARTISPDFGLDPMTLMRLAEQPEALADSEYCVAIQLLGEDDEPIAGARYRIELPGGGFDEGRTGPDGQAMVWGLARAGECRVTFPDLDEEAWQYLSSQSLS